MGFFVGFFPIGCEMDTGMQIGRGAINFFRSSEKNDFIFFIHFKIQQIHLLAETKTKKQRPRKRTKWRQGNELVAMATAVAMLAGYLVPFKIRFHNIKLTFHNKIEQNELC